MDPSAGRARGRARGRGRGEEPVQEGQVRRPGEGLMPEQAHTGSGWSAAGGSGRAASGSRERAQEEAPGSSSGRAKVSYRGAAPSATAEVAPGQPTVSEPSRASAGRGASRGREQQREIIVTRAPGFKKEGSYGSIITLGANYFELKSRPNMHLLQYRVDFTPDIDHIGVRKALVRSYEAQLGKYLFDGTLLYNVIRLPQPCEFFAKRTSDGTDVKITLRLVGEIQKNDAMYTTIMNIIVRRCLGMLNLVQVKRDFFDNKAAQDIPQHDLTIWPGYLTTIRHHENGYLLGVEIIHKVLRRDTALDVMTRIQQAGRDVEANCKAALLGAVVMTRYNNKTYRIDDVDFSMNPQSTFHLRKEDRDISYMEYYSKRYQVTIRSATQPLLVSRPSRRDVNRGDDQPIYLIPELCGMTGLSDDQRTNFNLMKEVGHVTRVAPDRRVDSLMRFRRRLEENAEIQKELTSWGLKFSENIVQFQGRAMPSMDVVQGHNQYKAEEGDWSRKLHLNPMAVSAELNQWVIFLPSQMANEVRSFVQQLRQVGQKQKFAVPEPSVVPMQADRTNNYLESIDNECRRMDYNMVMCVMRSNRKDTYAAIKKKVYCQMGVPSQVITGRILRGQPNKLQSIATKVMIQMASKLGAEPWRVALPSTRWMVIGYDTYHDARQRKAVGAFVASLNPFFTRYYSSVKLHENNEEISPSFQDHLLGALKAYYQRNRELPQKLIFYRDGVGAGDIARLKDTEIAAIRAACADASAAVKQAYNPGITFTVVSKRINSRFFAIGRVVGNPPCGTVVDNTVTLDERYDFFLVSQKVTQGTVSPTSFNIIEDTSGLTPDIQQRLAYSLTHLYYNWPGTLRVPAPVQYAHKLAYMVGESLMGVPHANLSQLPYYL